MQLSLSRALSVVGVMFLLTSIAAHAEMPEWVSRGQFLASVGLNHADVTTETFGGGGFSSETTGSETGTMIEGAYNYPLGKSFSIEGGLMNWSIGDFNGTGLTASALYQFKNAGQLGLGIIPDGFRVFGRYHFGKTDDEGRKTGLYGQIALNGYTKDQQLDSGDVGLDSWLSVGIGYAF